MLYCNSFFFLLLHHSDFILFNPGHLNFKAMFSYISIYDVFFSKLLFNIIYPNLYILQNIYHMSNTQQPKKCLTILTVLTIITLICQVGALAYQAISGNLTFSLQSNPINVCGNDSVNTILTNIKIFLLVGFLCGVIACLGLIGVGVGVIVGLCKVKGTDEKYLDGNNTGINNPQKMSQINNTQDPSQINHQTTDNNLQASVPGVAQPLITNSAYYPPYFTNRKFTTAFIFYLIIMILVLGYAAMILTVLVGYAMCVGLVLISYIVVVALGIISFVLMIVCVVLTRSQKSRYVSMGEPNQENPNQNENQNNNEQNQTNNANPQQQNKQNNETKQNGNNENKNKKQNNNIVNNQNMQTMYPLNTENQQDNKNKSNKNQEKQRDRNRQRENQGERSRERERQIQRQRQRQRQRQKAKNNQDPQNKKTNTKDNKETKDPYTKDINNKDNPKQNKDNSNKNEQKASNENNKNPNNSNNNNNKNSTIHDPDFVSFNQNKNNKNTNQPRRNSEFPDNKSNISSKNTQNHSTPKFILESQKQFEKQKQRQLDRQKQRERQKQIEKQKDRQNNQKENPKDLKKSQNQKEREREKEKDREKEKQKQKQKSKIKENQSKINQNQKKQRQSQKNNGDKQKEKQAEPIQLFSPERKDQNKQPVSQSPIIKKSRFQALRNSGGRPYFKSPTKNREHIPPHQRSPLQKYELEEEQIYERQNQNAPNIRTIQPSNQSQYPQSQTKPSPSQLVFKQEQKKFQELNIPRKDLSSSSAYKFNDSQSRNINNSSYDNNNESKDFERDSKNDKKKQKKSGLLVDYLRSKYAD